MLNKEFHTNGVTLSIKTGPKLLDVYHFVNEAINAAHQSHWNSLGDVSQSSYECGVGRLGTCRL